jgi:hypothetical protein
MTTTTFRQDMRAGLYAWLGGFKTTQGSAVDTIHKRRPKSLTPPCIYMGSLSEPQIVQGEGNIRTRYMTPQVVLVERLIDVDESAELMDPLVDAFIDYATANPHIGDFAVIEPVSAMDIELDYGGGAVYSATVVTLRAQTQEGRN